MPQAKSKELKLLHSWQGEFLLLIIFALLSYAFFSLAFDSAKTLEYVAGIIFGILAIKNFARLVKHLIRR